LAAERPGPAAYALRSVYWVLLDLSPLAAPLACRGPGIPVWLAAPMRALGVSLIAWGVLLNVVAGRALRLYGHSTPGPRFRAPDRLVDVGVYSCMRHPAQLGLIMVGVGVGLLTGGLPGILATAIPIAGGLAFILLVEEPEARRLLGASYHEYEDRVPAFTLDPRCTLAGVRVLRAPRRRPSS
jgi:protein-S-isoprenylcysteine O-methyltransferase Ste14